MKCSAFSTGFCVLIIVYKAVVKIFAFLILFSEMQFNIVYIRGLV